MTPHEEYVASGMCPFVKHKTWCNDKAGHTGPHWALYLEPGYKTRKVILQ